MQRHLWRSRTGLLVWLAFFVASAAAGSACSSERDDVTTNPQVDVSVTSDMSAYASGEPITITLEVTNRTAAPLTFEFSSGQRYDFVIHDEAGETVWRWSRDKAFMQMLGQETVAPGSALTYVEVFQGELLPGSYTVIGDLVATNRPLSGSTAILVE
jgi:hypothetical protein